ncbi:separase isoform X1 [Tanacetum coccineum]
MFGCLCFASILSNHDKLTNRSEKCVMMGFSSSQKGYRLFSLDRHQFLVSRDVKFFESIFPFKESVSNKNKTSNVFQDNNLLTFFDLENPELPDDDESVRNNHNSDPKSLGTSSSTDSGDNAHIAQSPSFGDIHYGNSDDDVNLYEEVRNLDENQFSEGTLEINPSTSSHGQNQRGNLEGTSNNPAQGAQELRRSTRSSVFPKNYNDFVVDSKVKYGIEKFVSYSKLSGDILCFVTHLNKNSEPRSFFEASQSPQWIDAMNLEMSALLENDTWELVELPFGRKALNSKWVWKLKFKSSGDFYLNRSQSKVKESDDMKSARDFYIKAKTTLNKDVWNNTKCLPKPEIMDTNNMKKSRELPKSEMSKNPQFCCAFGISGACEYAEDCWHCGPSISEKSLFLNASIHMKWEYIRRRHMVRLLTRLGKYCKLQGKNAKEYSYLLESTSENKSLLEEHAYKFAQFGSHVHLSDISWEVDKLSMESVMLGLKLAFILSREFRKLHEKVSRLLAVMYAYSEDYSTPERVSVSRCASYFHQSSTGSYFNSCFLSQDQNLNLVDDLREVLAPRSLTMLETSVSKFFDMLPEISILCISMLDGDSEKLLKHLLPQSSTSVWIMISKMSLNRRPILVIRPICEVFEDIVKANPSLVGNWSCPWAHNVFDKLAPRLRRILEEDNKLVQSEMESQKMKKERRILDKNLRDLLRDMESKWFGSWIHLLCGEWSDNQDIKNRLTKDALVDKNEKLCKKPVILVLDNDIQMFPIENMPLLIKKEIYRMPSVGGIIWSISKHKRSTEDKTVVDPWDQTVIDPRNCYYLIYTDTEDTKNCFEKWSKTYEFKGRCIDWSKSRDAPETLGVDTLSELRDELKTRDLFVYMGHGDGRKLIQAEEIRKMDSCGAVFLIGCSSGYINYSKSSVPDGAPLDYLLGNSPAIVANMWVVSTGCMNLFTTELLQALIDTKLAEVVACDQAAHEKVDDNKNPNKRKAEDEDNGSTGLCVHNRNLGSSFIKAREIAGRIKSYKDIAATVVYGVPVYITGNNVNP